MYVCVRRKEKRETQVTTAGTRDEKIKASEAEFGAVGKVGGCGHRLALSPGRHKILLKAGAQAVHSNASARLYGIISSASLPPRYWLPHEGRKAVQQTARATTPRSARAGLVCHGSRLFRHNSPQAACA